MSDQVLAQWWKRVSSISSYDTSMTDLVLVSGDGERVVCHQLVLAMASPVLHTLLQDQQGEEVVIKLPDVEGRMVRMLLGVLYNGYLPPNIEDQQGLDKVAQVVGIRVRQGKSNIVYKESGGLGEFVYEPFLEEQTTFLYVEDVKPDEMFTLDESGTNEIDMIENEKLEFTSNNIKQNIVPRERPVEGDTEGDMKDQSHVKSEKETSGEKVIIVPIDSHEEILHETVEFEDVEESAAKLKSVTNVSAHGSDNCALCQRTKFSHKEGGSFFCCQCKKRVLGSKLGAHVKKHAEKLKSHAYENQTDGVHLSFSNEKNKCEVNSLTNSTNAFNNLLTQPTTSSGVPRIKCPSCSKSMTRRHYTKHHKASCSKERILKCDICAREGFCNSSTLQDHIRAKHTHEKPFKCEHCNKAFPAASHLAHHRMKKHRVNSKGELQPKIVFPCNYCGKILTTKPKLLAHVKVIHQGIKDFTCSSCSKSFSSKSNLDIHVGSVHTGNLPYKCEFCSKSFARKNLLSAHRQTAHQFIEAQSVHSQGPL